MRIHTSTLKPDLIGLALNGNAGRKAKDVSIHILSTHGSRGKWARGYEVALRGHGARHTKRPNTGITGSNSDEYAATYDDWGWFLAALFVFDPDARCGPYKNADDFARQTKGKYTL
jgi:hypothetical protein